MVGADWLLLGLLVLALFCGWRVGSIRVVAGCGSVIIGYQLAREFSAAFALRVTQSWPNLAPSGQEGDLLQMLSLLIDTNTVANRLVQTAAFVVIFVVAVYLIRKLAHLLDGVFRGTILGVVNNALGAVCALAVFILGLQILLSYLFPVLDSNETVLAVERFLLQSQTVLPWISSGTSLVLQNLPAAL